jgi:hypothetical protein
MNTITIGAMLDNTGGGGDAIASGMRDRTKSSFRMAGLLYTDID